MDTLFYLQQHNGTSLSLPLIPLDVVFYWFHSDTLDRQHPLLYLTIAPNRRKTSSSSLTQPSTSSSTLSVSLRSAPSQTARVSLSHAPSSSSHRPGSLDHNVLHHAETVVVSLSISAASCVVSCAAFVVSFVPRRVIESSSDSMTSRGAACDVVSDTMHSGTQNRTITAITLTYFASRRQHRE